LFAGYMLMQFPGGYVGDRLGHRTVIVISIIWAGVATILSGTLRDATGDWTAAVMLDAGIILASFVLLLFVREPREEVEGAAPAGTRPEPG
jgi:MFS family permease